jgi:hypothetical protein
MPHVAVGAENGAVILPYRATAARLPGLIREVKLVTVEGGPHNIGWPPDGVNTALPEFLISQPGGTCRQSAASPDICLRYYPGLILPASSTDPDPAEGGAMELPATGYDAIDCDESSVHDWHVSELTRLGLPGPLAKVYADRIDWHQIARLVCHGCPPRLALRIVC